MNVISDPVPFAVHTRSWIYRLWDAEGNCLYVGQHRGIHPAVRVNQHRVKQPWWDEVARADFVEVLDGDLSAVEKQQIAALNARYNNGGWQRLHPEESDHKPGTRSILSVSIDGAIKATLVALAIQQERPVSRVTEDLLREGLKRLGLPVQAEPVWSLPEPIWTADAITAKVA